MTEVVPVHEEFASLFQKWARNNLTSSFKKSSIIRNMENNTSVNDVDQLIKSLRQTKLIEPPSTWDSKNRRWWNACSSCNLHDMTQLLVEDSTLIRWKNPFDGWTALHYVAKNGNLRCLDLLVKQYNTEVNIQSKNGSTPLHIAVMFSQRLFVRYLVEIYGARTDIMDYSGRFPLTIIPPELTDDLQTLLCSGRLARIRQSLSILKVEPKPPALQSSRHALISAAEGTLTRIHHKATGKSVSSSVSEPTRLLLSTLSGGEDQDVSKIIRCLHHGQSVTVPPDPATKKSSKASSSSSSGYLSLSRKSALPPTHILLNRKQNSNESVSVNSSSSKSSTLNTSNCRRLSHTLSLRSTSQQKYDSDVSLPPAPECHRSSLFRVPSSSVFSLPRKRRVHKQGSSVNRQHHHFSLPRKMSGLLGRGRVEGKENKAELDDEMAKRFSFSGFPQISDEKEDKHCGRLSTAFISRQSSLKSSVDSAMYPSMSSSSVDPPRSPSISSLTEFTEALLEKYLPSSPSDKQTV